MNQSKAAEFGTGLFIIFGIVALLFLATQTAHVSFASGDTYKVTAVFHNVGGLKEGSAVRMAGVKIGRVASIRLDPKRLEAIVTLRIRKKYDTLPRDSVASVLTSGILGEQYVGLSPGASLKYLENGDKIIFTQSAVILEHLIGQFVAGMGSSE